MKKIFCTISLILFSQMSMYAMQSDKYIHGFSFENSKDCKSFYDAITVYLNQNSFKQDDRILAQFDSKNNKIFKLYCKDLHNFIYISHSSELKQIILCGLIDNIFQEGLNSFLGHLKESFRSKSIDLKIEEVAFESYGQKFNANLCIPIGRTIDYKKIFAVIFDFVRVTDSDLVFLAKNINLNLQGKQFYLEDLKAYKFQLLFTCDIFKSENNYTFANTIFKILNLTTSQASSLKPLVGID